MAVLRLDLGPSGDQTAFTRTYTLDGARVSFRCYWMDRIRRWHIEMVSPDGDVLSAPQQASPGGEFIVDGRDPRIPGGRFVWGPGPEPDARGDLGVAVVRYYVTETPPSTVAARAIYKALGL